MSRGATVRRSITSTEMPSAPSALRGGQRLVDHPRDRDDRDVGAGAHDGGLADREHVVGRRLRALHAVEQPVLDEDHRVRVLDGGPQQAVGVGRRRRHDDGQPRDVGQQRLEALRVLAARRAPGAELGPHGQRHLRRAAGHERQLGRLVEQLVEADAEEVEVHQLDHGAHPGHGRTDAEADDRRLGDRRVAHPSRTRSASPRVSPKTLPPAPTSMPATNTRSSSASSAARAERMASMVRNTGASAAGGAGSGRAGPRPHDEVGQGRRGRGRPAGAPPRPPRRARRPPTPPGP